MTTIDNASGVNYGGGLDYSKVLGQRAAALTDGNLDRFGIKPILESRGESTFLIKVGECLVASTEEGLGTKELVARKMDQLVPGVSHYRGIGQDNVAMCVNDVITLGALPLVFSMHLAVGDAAWLTDTKKVEALYDGTRHACDLAGCVWGGGETPELRGVVYPDAAVLSGSVVGASFSSKWFDPKTIAVGDAIIFCSSSGIHANGLTKCREIAEYVDPWWKRLLHVLAPWRFPLRMLPDGYLTKLADGRTYGDTLLDPTHIYARLVELCVKNTIEVHYAVNITGHGWRKLMRAPQPYTYRIKILPTLLPIFQFVRKRAGLTLDQMYAAFNMGVGFALYIAEKDTDRFFELVWSQGWEYDIFRAGVVEEGEKRVVIEPLGIEYKGNTLAVR